MIQLIEVESFVVFDILAPQLALFSGKDSDFVAWVYDSQGGIVEHAAELPKFVLDHMRDCDAKWYFIVGRAKKPYAEFGAVKKWTLSSAQIQKILGFDQRGLRYFNGLDVDAQVRVGRTLWLLESADLPSSYIQAHETLRPFALQDAFTSIRLGETLDILRSMEERNEEPLPAVSALFTAHITLFAIHEVGQRVATERLKKHPFYMEKLAMVAPKYCRKVNFHLGARELGSVLTRIKRGVNPHIAAKSAILNTLVTA